MPNPSRGMSSNREEEGRKPKPNKESVQHGEIKLLVAQ